MMISLELDYFLMKFTFPFKKLDHNIYYKITSYIGKYSNNIIEIIEYCKNYEMKKKNYYLKLKYIDFLISESRFNNLNFDILTNIFSFVGTKNLYIENKIHDIKTFYIQKERNISKLRNEIKYIDFIIDELPVQLNRNVFSNIFSFLQFNEREMFDLVDDADNFEFERLNFLNPKKYYSEDEYSKDENYYDYHSNSDYDTDSDTDSYSDSDSDSDSYFNKIYIGD